MRPISTCKIYVSIISMTILTTEVLVCGFDFPLHKMTKIGS